MKRREFIGAGAVAATLGGAGCLSLKQADRLDGGRELIEIRHYQCATVERRMALERVLDRALIPALERQGIRPVGVFWADAQLNEGATTYEKSVFAVIPYRDAHLFLHSAEKLLRDSTYLAAADELFKAPMAAPLYNSLTSSLLYGFQSCPQVRQVTAAPERVLQLRIYNSYTPERNRKKIEMFEEGGEIDIFRACGMEPLFFGAGIAGEQLDNLTYMLGFENLAAKESSWRKFRAHPKWLNLKVEPQYSDTANKITNIVLRPSPGSQL